MDCLACRTPLAEHMRFCPVCGTLVRPLSAAAVDEPVRRQLEHTLGAQYELLRVIGRGAMGIVYLARDRGLENLVAIKVLPPELASAPELRERFRREARFVAHLSHPGILQLHRFGEVEGFAYFVMRYVRGQSLAELLRHEARLTPDTARRILAELADALDYAHRHGVIHRDIKPENVLIEDETARAILADFGIAKARSVGADSLTLTGSILGTPPYMAPEQVIDGTVDERSDLFSLGVLGYAMLTGRSPFEGMTIRDTLAKIVNYDPPPLLSVVPEAPGDFAAAIMRCLVKDPAARMPDARTLHRAVADERVPEAGVPDDLRELASFGTWAILWSVVWGWLIAREYAAGEDILIFALLAVLVPTGFALQAWNIERKGFRRRDILHVALWPPKWWGLWWPAPLRRPDDVWRCLPTSVRTTRAVLTAFFLLTPLAAYVQRSTWARSLTDVATRRLWLGGVEYGLLVASAIVVAAVAWRWRGRGFATDDLAKLLVGPTASTAFWTRPSVVAFLRSSPAMPSSCPPTPQTPHEYLRAIALLAGELAGGARAVATDAVAAAGELRNAIDALDQEIAMLSRDAEPAEASRLEQRLAALGGEGRDPDEEQLRALLRRQLDLIGRLRTRLELATASRERLVMLGRELWLALARQRELPADQNRDHGELRERVASLCAAIDEERSALPSRGVEIPSPVLLPGQSRREAPLTS